MITSRRCRRTCRSPSSTWPATARCARRLHHHFGDAMKYSGQIGLTHRSFSPDEPELPGAKPAWFFAPDQIRKRAREWGPGGIDQRFGAAWSSFAPTLPKRLTVIEGRGPARSEQIYLDTLNGRIPPAQGHILSLCWIEAAFGRAQTRIASASEETPQRRPSEASHARSNRRYCGVSRKLAGGIRTRARKARWQRRCDRSFIPTVIGATCWR